MTSENADRIAKALAWAIEAHEGQVRKGTAIPYVSHPLQVAGIALEHGADGAVVTAALLHDVLEDTPTTYAELREAFGPRVADIVRSCSDTEDHEAKGPWRERKEHYLSHLEETGPDALLVSAADKLHNARTLLADLREDGVAVFEKFRGKRDGTLWYYRRLVATFGERGIPPRLLRELQATVEQILALSAAAEA